MVKNQSASAGTQDAQVRSLVQEDSLEEEPATHSNILAGIIPWMEEPDGLQSIGLEGAGRDCMTEHTHTHTHIHTHTAMQNQGWSQEELTSGGGPRGTENSRRERRRARDNTERKDSISVKHTS